LKLAIFSDIHSNIEALEACCAVAEQHGVDAYACLGDSVNYGPDPVATLDRILSLPGLIAVLGNHDQAMFQPPLWPANSELEQSAAWTRKRLHPEHLHFLKELPFMCEAHGATFTHASFDFPDNWEYVVSAKQAHNCFRAVPARRLFMGHVHVPLFFCETDDKSVVEMKVEAGRTYMLSKSQRYLANVGSVGQPRDGVNTASFAIYDNSTDSITFLRVPYDFAATARKIHDADLPALFAERLAKGQ